MSADSAYADALLACDGFVFEASRECLENALALAVLFFANRDSWRSPRSGFRPLQFEVIHERVDDALVSDQQARGALRPERDQRRIAIDDLQLCRELTSNDADLFSIKEA